MAKKQIKYMNPENAKKALKALKKRRQLLEDHIEALEIYSDARAMSDLKEFLSKNS